MNQQLQKLIEESGNIVFFGGAGVSTESGIPDFRSADGLYMQNAEIPPETILSHSFFMRHTDLFFDFYKKHMLYLSAKPNPAHLTLAALEAQGKLSAVVTQNIDGLHQSAGSKRVLELHGSVHRNFCMDCGKAYTAEDILRADGVPRCECGGIIKPDVVLYEESLPDDTVREALSAISRADMLIIGGTSLSVYPAASFVQYYRGHKLVLINKSETPMDRAADLLIRDPIGQALALS